MVYSIKTKWYILRDQGQKYIYFFGCILGEGRGWKENKREQREPVH